MDFTETVLLSSIDHTLASVRAALAAAADPEQFPEAITELAGMAGSNIAVLTHSALTNEWQGIPEGVFDAMRQAQVAAQDNDLEEVERVLAGAREQIGGRSA